MMTSILLTDFYKTDHLRQYPKNTTSVYSNFTPRISRMKGIDHIVVFGIQYLIKFILINHFNRFFFMKDKDRVVASYKRIMDSSLGKGVIDTKHLQALHDLDFLPIEIKALPEGILCPLKTPVLTIRNTHPDFAWLPNFLETLISNTLWHLMTSATIAFEYRKVLERYAEETSDQKDFVKWQGHDFSMRGQNSMSSAMGSGAAHLLSFTGTDTIPAIGILEEIYGADCEKELIGGSVPATEHSVMCLGGEGFEEETFHRLITEVYPTGVISVVCDTWDYWHFISTTLPSFKDQVMKRNGKVVIRPDSGDPVKIICGDEESTTDLERMGSIQILWNIFGGTINSKGFKQLNSHIGLIYGDSITLERCKIICSKLKLMGFASTNVVFGIGSYTYQYVTRDTFGFAMKATHAIVDGKPMNLSKDPLTDGNREKKSAKGLLRVNKDLTLSECVSEEEEKEGLLRTVFINGRAPNQTTLAEIRARIDSFFGGGNDKLEGHVGECLDAE